MTVVMVGLNHTTAPVEIRERLVFNAPDSRALLSRWSCAGGGKASPSGTIEGAILSTCNRMELYAVAHDAQQGQASLRKLIAEARGLPDAEFLPHLYQLAGDEAIRHLLRVASGLDSMILGEPQILGQVVDAGEMARSVGSGGPVLLGLFRAAIHCGKRVRTETGLAENAASVSSMAARLVAEAFDDLAACIVLVLGAGEMGQLAVQAIRQRGQARVIVVNRTYDRASALAEEWNGEALPFERLTEALERADVLVSCTDAPHVLIHEDVIRRAQIQRGGRPLVVVDIAVPRDVAPEVAQVPGVRLYDMDGLQAWVGRNLDERSSHVPAAERIVEEELLAFQEYLSSRDVLPTIVALREHAEAIRQLELHRALRRLDHLSSQEQEVVQSMTRSMVNKLLHTPVSRLKVEANNGQSELYARVVQDLFDL